MRFSPKETRELLADLSQLSGTCTKNIFQTILRIYSDEKKGQHITLIN